MPDDALRGLARKVEEIEGRTIDGNLGPRPRHKPGSRVVGLVPAHRHRQRRSSRLVKLYEERASLRTIALAAAFVAAILCLLSATVGCAQEEEWTAAEQTSDKEKATLAGGLENAGSPGGMIRT